MNRVLNPGVELIRKDNQLVTSYKFYFTTNLFSVMSVASSVCHTKQTPLYIYIYSKIKTNLVYFIYLITTKLFHMPGKACHTHQVIVASDETRLSPDECGRLCLAYETIL